MTLEHIVEVTGLSPKATEQDVYTFFAFCGTIEHVDIVRAGEYACTAYVTFKDAYALETAVLLSGATLLDQTVCITRWGQDVDESEFWNRPSWSPDDGSSSNVSPQANQYAYTAGEAVTLAQDVVKTMLAKGYILGKDALGKAQAFDESHQVSASAAAKVAELSERIGLTDKVFAGVEAVRSVDQRYHISDTTKSVVSATGRTAAAAATTVVNSSYFSKGALWMSDALNRAAKAAADLGSHGISK
ncbi:binding partner of ACD11 1 [Cynara cardunculus var. scolymus]|uniref:Nucleotide-binding, alpha-beta plait n=1 Tax=Cynara cardunculus var. scolymus TaxID=59895 RepID=A0A118K378_CYNCS|nr:binding partner of ACD11 1 [Cynara cardunculus var. scolymus]XP_024991280.1 binding partner of ACD11 1 [Cynara cardunculus var. scolymus]KVI05488.1 Nucleotide-binding, alpha-beta plait [Cynara cardunculus var. scolymus]